ncbi:hypothetical protein KVT40_000789 [Elsinoe batatas]|uniref:BTB domain-containing protein n=1 Tax=Elsinoe batatas TaxID=2601811 RepID=A0A8K0PN06_9PEZI|nr:hypothetical protein KVT40_000789 [Elsinoe batatas]
MAPKRSQTRTRSKSKERIAPYNAATKAPIHTRFVSPGPRHGRPDEPQPYNKKEHAKTLYKSSITVTVGGGDVQTQVSYECYPEHLRHASDWFADRMKKFNDDFSTAEIKVGFADPQAFVLFYHLCLSGMCDSFAYRYEAVMNADADELIECYDLARKLKSRTVQNLIISNLYGRRDDKSLFSAAIIKSVFSTKGHALVPRNSGLNEFIERWTVFNLDPSVLTGSSPLAKV